MHYILDAIIVAIIVIFTWVSAKKGFVKAIVLLLGFVLASTAAKVVSTPLSQMIYDSFIKEQIVISLEEKTSQITGTISEQTEQLTNSLPDIVKNAVAVFGKETDSIAQTVEETGNSVSQVVEERMVAPAVISLIQTVLFILLFSVFLFIIKRVARMMGFINKIPLIGKVNVFLGGILGTLEGVIFSFVVVTAVYVAMLLSGEAFIITPKDIDSSTVYKFFYENNPLI